MAGISDRIKSMNRRVSRWAQETSTAINEWWEEVNAIQERRNEIREMARERRKLLVELGTKVYSLHRKGKVLNRDLLRDCERIDEIGETVERLEREIAELKRSKSVEPPTEVEVEDETPVVGEEDIETTAGEDIEPEVDEEGAEPCAPAESPADETTDTRAECAPCDEPGGSGEDIEPEVEKEAAMPGAHAQDATEEPEGDVSHAEAAQTRVEKREPTFGASPATGADVPETDKEGAEPCAHAEDAAEGPAEETGGRRPECCEQ